MSIYTRRSLMCEGTDCNMQIDAVQNDTAASLRRVARRDGWTRIGGRDLCKDCAYVVRLRTSAKLRPSRGTGGMA